MNSDPRHPRWWALVLSALTATACSAAPPPKPPETSKPTVSLELFNEYSDPGVVVIAPSSDSSDDPLLDIQLDMAQHATRSGPVLIMVSDARSRNLILGACRKFPDICNAMQKGTLRVVEVPHEGPWVRDYGPQIGVGADGVPVVIDASYEDFRQRRDLRRKRRELDRQRLLYIRMREELDRQHSIMSDAHDEEDDEDADMVSRYLRSRARTERLSGIEEEKRNIDERLELLRHKIEVYSNEGIFSRDEDDDSPFFLAQSALRDTRFRLARPPVVIDGGNLMRLSDGACATTSDIVPANGGKDAEIERALARDYGCRKVIFLAPLPGPVIKHVDMFLLPVEGNLVALAAYDPADPLTSKYWADAEESVQTLMMEASLAMDANAKVLQQHGYRVLRVGALLPRIDLEAGIYYPTVLNALVRVDGNGRRHVMLPTYAGYQEDLQSAAVDKLRAAFERAEVVTIEATEAAKRQGAVHCLSLVIPSRLSIFADGATAVQVERMLAVIGEMQQNQDTAKERLIGNWRSQGDDGVRFVFGKDGDGLILGDGGMKVIRYSIRTAGTVLAVSTDGGSTQYQIEWKSPRHVRLVPSSKAAAIELVRATE
ncbi:agmatine deiminase family protein [Sorangium cellulosum]|uniref:agmatine deiminase family protein n=1 Tax=Sorangium cellulosum TaxID=56 RepID=UPI003D9A651C